MTSLTSSQFAWGAAAFVCAAPVVLLLGLVVVGAGVKLGLLPPPPPPPTCEPGYVYLSRDRVCVQGYRAYPR